MRKKFCPKCGREVEKLYESLCEKCFLGKTKLEIPEKIVVKECRNCGKIYFEKDSAESIEGMVDKTLSKILEKPDVESASYRIEGDKIHVTLNLKYHDLEKSEEKTILLISKKITCESCSMKAVGYYQAILQLRVPEKLLDVIIEDVKNQIDLFRKYDTLSFISKIEKKKNGADVYIGSKSVANNIAKNIKTKFGAETKLSSKLSGLISGRKVYRDTILISIGE